MNTEFKAILDRRQKCAEADYCIYPGNLEQCHKDNTLLANEYINVVEKLKTVSKEAEDMLSIPPAAVRNAASAAHIWMLANRLARMVSELLKEE